MKDIGHAAPPISGFVASSDHAVLDGSLYLAISDGSSGVELWKSDGTPEGTDMVRDIAPGSLSSNPAGLTAFNGSVYFAASEPTTGRELWVTDGTSVGTHLVKDIRETPTEILVTSDSSPAELTVFGGLLYFIASDVEHGRELWVTDGTSEGTQIVSDLWPGQPGSSPHGLAVMGGSLYFFAAAPGSPYGLFRLAPGAFNPVLLRNFVPASTGGRFPFEVPPFGLTAAGSIAFFTASDGIHGAELWKTDGTPDGTVMVRDINPSGNSFPAILAGAQGRVFFAANDGVTGQELWTSDGTLAGTVLVRDLVPGPGSSNPLALGMLGGSLLFFASDPAQQKAVLWKTDGTFMGTVALKSFSSASSRSVTLNSQIYFSAGDAEHGFELWRTDGTAEGTALFRDIWPGPTDSNLSFVGVFSDRLFFSASDGRAASIWATDGTPEGTKIVRDVFFTGSSPSFFVAFGSRVFFAAADGGVVGPGGVNTSRRLWVSDGTEAGTRKFLDNQVVFPGDFFGGFPIVWRDHLYFSATDESGTELWKSDGSEAGTARLKDVVPGSESSYPAHFNPVADALCFFARDPRFPFFFQLWKTDGSEEGTLRVSATVGYSFDDTVTAVSRGQLFFSGEDSINAGELWRSDGTSAGTIMLKDIKTGPGGSGPHLPTNVDGTVFFHAYDDGGGSGLWRTDGTQAGTVLVKEFQEPNSLPSFLTPFKGKLFFIQGSELWRSDGTETGTVPLKSFRQLYGSFTTERFVPSGDSLFFSADDGVSGIELWKTDGTPEGTLMVRDILRGLASSSPESLADAGGVLLFAASDGEHGTELWRSDGTESGTFLLQDINPGPRSSNPSGFTRVGDQIFFSADDGSSGSELWVLPASDLASEPRTRVKSPRELPFRR